MEAENTAASDAGISAWSFLFYLPAEITHASDPDEKHEWLNSGLEAYLASSNKSSMQFWVTVIADSRYGLAYPTSDPWKYLDDFADYVANLMTDPQYLKINGKPVIGLFTGGDVTMSLAQWQQFLTPAGGQSAVFGIAMSGFPSDAFTTYGLQARFVYGTQNLDSGLGHKPFSYSSDKDKAIWTRTLLTGESRISQVTPANDGRALDSTVTSRTFVDAATQPRWYQHFNAGLGLSTSKMVITFWNESAEEGAAVHPTAQEGSRFLQGVKWARTGNLPSTYTYPVSAYNADTAIIESSGTWTYTGPLPTGVAGAHDRDQVVSSETGAYKTLVHERLEACDVYAETGPDCGDVEIYKNEGAGDVLVTTVDCYAASQTTSAKIATVTFSGPPATRRVKARVKGTKNASSSSVQIKLDYFKPTYIP